MRKSGVIVNWVLSFFEVKLYIPYKCDLQMTSKTDKSCILYLNLTKVEVKFDYFIN